MTVFRTLFERSRNLLLYQQYIPTDYYVLDNRELVYISTPKVACTSIKIAMMGNELEQGLHKEYMNIHSLANSYLQHHLQRKQQSYYKFAFVRNPFDRLVSCYEDKVRKARQHHGRYYFETRYNSVLIKSLFGNQFHVDMTFDEFISLVCKIPDSLADGHFKSQYATLFRHGKRIPDYVGQFEKLAEDWEPMAQQFGFSSLGQKNPSKRENWKQYYANPETVAQVAKRFHHDIREFGYEDSYNELRRASNI